MRAATKRHRLPLALLLAAACGGGSDPPPPPPVATPIRVSGSSPFAPACHGAPQSGVRYADSEVEPHLAVHPVNPDHLVATWQQDRWSNGGADGNLAAVSLDGGVTWTPSMIPFSRCAGGTAPAGDHQRASDPWVSFAAGGVVHAVGLGFDRTTPRSSIVVSRSTDGGLTWSPAQAVATESDPDVALDKPTLTADPGRPGHVYAVWDRLSGLASADPQDFRGPAFLARSTDEGVTWEPERLIHDPGPDAQTISSQIVVLPDGTLVNVFVRIFGATGTSPVADVVAIRSDDAGDTWSPTPVVVAPLLAVGAVDPRNGSPVRAGEVVPSSAVDGAGRLWVAWQDARFSGGARDGIALASSDDGGLTFSPPLPVNRAPAVQAFRPAVAAGPGGEVAVTYYDFRLDDPADPDRVWTVFWRATSSDAGLTWDEVALGGPFDLRSAPFAGGWFLGDYTGLVPRRGGFHALFSMGRSALGGDATDAWASAAPGAPVAAEVAAVQGNARPVPLAERLKAMRDAVAR